MNKFLPILLSGSFFLLYQLQGEAQDKRFQYPAALSNSFSGVSIGYINYPFSNRQLEPGFSARNVHIPHIAVRILLFGHQFNRYLSAQLSYMRPVDWIEYKNINGDSTAHSVWMNIAGLSLKAQTPGWKNFSLFGETGVSVVTRKGFSINNVTAMKNANYAMLLTGAGLQYQLKDKWRLMLSLVYLPKNSKSKQPPTSYYAAGFVYTMKPLSSETTKRAEAAGFFFPRNLVQLGFTTNGPGYGVNNAVSKGPVPIFWAGDVQVRRGVSFSYQHNIFHSRKVFAWDWGINLSYWQSRRNRNTFFTASLYPLLRFIAFRSESADVYFDYSVAGPSFISRTVTDDANTGRHFTFQDYMGMGAFIGSHKKLNAEIRIMHYSNGNIFPDNVGYMIPLTFNVGYTF